MKSFAVLLGVCVVLTAAAVHKRDTNPAEIDWQGAKKHIDEMWQLFQNQMGSAKEILGKTVEQTQTTLGDFVKKANETVQNYAPDVQKELQSLIANVQATTDNLNAAVKKNTPEMYNNYLTALETIKNQTEAVSTSLSPQVNEAAKVLAGLQQQLTTGFTALLEEASKVIKTGA